MVQQYVEDLDKLVPAKLQVNPFNERHLVGIKTPAIKPLSQKQRQLLDDMNTVCSEQIANYKSKLNNVQVLNFRFLFQRFPSEGAGKGNENSVPAHSSRRRS